MYYLTDYTAISSDGWERLAGDRRIELVTIGETIGISERQEEGQQGLATRTACSAKSIP